MKANRIHRFGPPAVIELEEIARPLPGAGEVLVRVDAAGVGPWDAWIRAGTSKVTQPLPLTLGSDLAGVVDSIGDGVSDLAVGDDVFGITNARFTGAYADYAVASAGMLAKRPRALSPLDAASVPVVAVTAWQMLFEHARIAPGQTVLVHGGAGNVGAYAVQLARGKGVRVIATASAADVDYVRGLGADEVIDHRATRFEDVLGRDAVDAVIDTVGGEVQRRSFAVLRRGGMLVSAVAPPDAGEAAARGVRALFFLVDVDRARLERIAALFDAGALTASIGTVLPLDQARAAHEILEGTRPRTRGKILLHVRP
jgi:NADPH:quinone reductase-like Zn-dependent oxidoreductase